MRFKSLSNPRVIYSIAIGISFLVFWNANSFFQELKVNETSKMKIWASAQQELEQLGIENEDLSLTAMNVLLSNNSTPMLLYTHDSDTYDIQNIKVKHTDTPEKINKLKRKFTKENQPIEMRANDKLLQTLYYGNSSLINKLKYYPILLILVFVLFFIALYFFYITTKASEQNKLWAGMAKETAHQIGTPLSSLVAWIEILKGENINPDYVKEIEKDINRLNTISDRFSKIGSIPSFKILDIVSETEKSLIYLKQRTSKLITYHMELPDTPILLPLNQELYSWTLENLIKNSIDAMKGKGDIYIFMQKEGEKVSLLIRDSGKGIPKKLHQAIFKPGYTSKKRGWGLGLSLSKRIIEEYHKGEIHVLYSSPNGTTMQITLETDRKHDRN